MQQHTGTSSDTPSADIPPQQSRTGCRLEGEDGMSTAEYAVLWAVVHSGTVHDMLASVLQHALSLGM